MALTHVCRWSKEDKKWVPVSLQEAVKMFPYQTVSADSGLFMCDLCKQYVILTNGRIYSRYFKHNSGDVNKECAERSTGPSVNVYMNPLEHSLPIKMFFTSSQFRFEIGFYSVPDSLMKDDHGSINIHNQFKTFTYSFERLQKNGITYFPAGGEIASSYEISISSARNRNYSKYWPAHISGITDGSMFDAETHKRLPEDADVTIQHHYYLLTKRSYPSARSVHVHVEKKAEIADGWTSWKVFDVYAETYDADVARFFFEHSCRLTEKPSRIFPVWPPYVASPYFIYHLGDRVFFYVEGDSIEIRTAPYQTNYRSGCLFSIQQQEKYVLVSTGRLKVIRYLYLAKENIRVKTSTIKFAVTDEEGKIVLPGEYNALPDKRFINIKLDYDGFAKIYQDNQLILKEKIAAKQTTKIPNIAYGMTMKIYIGLDCIWKASWNRKNNSLEQDAELLKRLKSYTGDELPVPHELAYIYQCFSNRPGIQGWLALCQRKGFISEKSFSLLKEQLV